MIITPNSIIPTLEKVHSTVRKGKRLLFTLTRSDITCVLVLILLSFILRIPSLEHPNVTQYDEVIYANYTMNMLEHLPFMDIHPPFARIIFTEMAKTAEPFTLNLIPFKFGQPFGDFPYIIFRTYVAFIGTLLPLIIYLLGRLFGFTPRISLLLGLFIATDNAFIIYSRVILPDIILVVCNFLSLLLIIAAVNYRFRKIFWPLIILGGIIIGCALSIKWTAAGILSLMLFILLVERKILAPIILLLTTGVIYIGIFIFSLSYYFPNGGTTDSFSVDNTHPWITQVDFPKINTSKDALLFLPELHEKMFRANNDPYVLSGTLKSLGVSSWPIAKSTMIFWGTSESDKKIILTGNSVLWVSSFFVFLFYIFYIAITFRRSKKINISKNEMILLAGYVMNYLPFFFIHRPMYLYHYFTALIFLILLMPMVVPRIVKCLGNVTNDHLFARVFVGATALSIFVNFLLTIRTVYGI